MGPIPVTKSFLPPREEYEHYIDRAWQSGILTNQSQLVGELETKLKEHLNLEHLHLVANGTLALQLALHTLVDEPGEVITTPFSYVATTSAILWERFSPVFVDIDPQTLNINPELIEAAITPHTKAILAVHVFGNPCDIEAIEMIAAKHNIKVIYDAAHAFGVRYQGKSLLHYGDVSTCSFHATKLFHTIEGGCIVTKDQATSDAIELMKRFGHNNDDHFMLGINAKMSEMHAAMGLSNLPYVENIITERKRISELYDQHLGDSVARQSKNLEKTVSNYAYYPVLFTSEEALQKVVRELNVEHIFPRRYFYPSLNTLPYLKEKQVCPVSEDISSRILCLPLYVGLDDATIEKISKVIKDIVSD